LTQCYQKPEHRCGHCLFAVVIVVNGVVCKKGHWPEHEVMTIWEVLRTDRGEDCDDFKASWDYEPKKLLGR
jgi:hypothetical protein